ncbi:DUF4097 domain-containing protein [Gracilibacillus caseinilyticus]|uniref:DUF4097 domain-containing protein n=1 Tax=Gracilibacillus caseinilyticus TaxID=2932256 RepID=A0ABY4EZ33_9BACI|nr:DUF4097 family beta strand repeat-containing protein [Gracilibacillus caseinilyticus]UOQ48899.1 DUF4097 domain-containing protein [Gracilibacillus caseinilyticus]
MVRIKRIVIIALILFIIGVIGSVATYKFAATGSTVTQTEQVKRNDVSNIEIDADNEMVEIIPTTDTAITVELTGKTSKNNEKRLFVEENNQTLSITVKSERFRFLSFDFFNWERSLTIHLPEKKYNRLTADVDNGSINAAELEVAEIEVETNNGKVAIQEMTANTIQAESDNGKIYIENVTADKMAVATDNGKIELIDVEGALQGKTSNGAISLKISHIDRAIDLETDNGSINIETEKEPTNAIFDTSTDNGRVSIFGDDDYDMMVGEGENEIKLQTNNGSITVTK